MARTRSVTASLSKSENQTDKVNSSSRRSAKISSRSSEGKPRKSNSPASRRRAKEIQPHEYFEGEKRPEKPTRSTGTKKKATLSTRSKDLRDFDYTKSKRSGDSVSNEDLSSKVSTDRDDSSFSSDQPEQIEKPLLVRKRKPSNSEIVPRKTQKVSKATKAHRDDISVESYKSKRRSSSISTNSKSSDQSRSISSDQSRRRRKNKSYKKSYTESEKALDPHGYSSSSSNDSVSSKTSSENTNSESDTDTAPEDGNSLGENSDVNNDPDYDPYYESSDPDDSESDTSGSAASDSETDSTDSENNYRGNRPHRNYPIATDAGGGGGGGGGGPDGPWYCPLSAFDIREAEDVRYKRVLGDPSSSTFGRIYPQRVTRKVRQARASPRKRKLVNRLLGDIKESAKTATRAYLKEGSEFSFHDSDYFKKSMSVRRFVNLLTPFLQKWETIMLIDSSVEPDLETPVADYLGSIAKGISYEMRRTGSFSNRIKLAIQLILCTAL